ncbi:MAG: DUF3106 domain-containing protein [Sulfurisoma sp.]|nr:DUF3106 domain-containing protein [Sulfurisoma sp.]
MARAFLAVVSITLSLLLPLPANAVVSTLTQQPSWGELTPQQKQILAPLAGEWDKLEAWRRKKWVGIAQRYPAMKPEEQARIQRRMKDWVKLTPEQRTAVREQYRDVRKATPEQKEVLKQKWQEYKELPEDEKTRLKAQAATKPVPKSVAGKPLAPIALPRAAPGTAVTTAPSPPAATLAPASAPPPAPPAQ